MSDPITLSCPQAAFDAIWARLHKTKAGTSTISISVKHLEALMIDHGRLLRAVPHSEPKE
jgi:hypothetical protein